MTAQPLPPRPTRRGLTYDDTLSGDVTIVRETLTPDCARQLAERGVTGVKIEASASADALAHLARVPTIRRIDLSGRRNLADRDLAFLHRCG